MPTRICNALYCTYRLLLVLLQFLPLHTHVSLLLRSLFIFVSLFTVALFAIFLFTHLLLHFFPHTFAHTLSFSHTLHTLSPFFFLRFYVHGCMHTTIYMRFPHTCIFFCLPPTCTRFSFSLFWFGFSLTTHCTFSPLPPSHISCCGAFSHTLLSLTLFTSPFWVCLLHTMPAWHFLPLSLPAGLHIPLSPHTRLHTQIPATCSLQEFTYLSLHTLLTVSFSLPAFPHAHTAGSLWFTHTYQHTHSTCTHCLHHTTSSAVPPAHISARMPATTHLHCLSFSFCHTFLGFYTCHAYTAHLPTST